MVNAVKLCLLACLVAACAAGPLPKPRVVGPDVPDMDTVYNGLTNELDSQINDGRYRRHIEEKAVGEVDGTSIADIETATELRASGSGLRSKRCAYTIAGSSSRAIYTNGCHVTITGAFDGQIINNGGSATILGSNSGSYRRWRRSLHGGGYSHPTETWQEWRGDFESRPVPSF